MKDQLLQSFKYRFLKECSKLEVQNKNHYLSWNKFLNNLVFKRVGEEMIVSWVEPSFGYLKLDLSKLELYVRGDTQSAIRKQKENLLLNNSHLRIKNEDFIEKAVKKIIEMAGYRVIDDSFKNRIQSERFFHDNWANMEDLRKIDVLKNNEICTAPEMRYIIKKLGDLKGKRLLDLGCGLGEASVFFALKGAIVTALDLSEGMLKATRKLAKLNNVEVRTILSSAENTNIDDDDKFDIIYAGNLLHHVDIEETLSGLTKHLKNNAKFVSWDPIAYNPIINVYRWIATSVRTDDEHPLILKDINLFKNYFSIVNTKYTWLTTLMIFIFMFLIEKRNPNKERYWKVVVHEGNKWAWLYLPLEKLDNLIIRKIPLMRFLCWNVVIIATK